MQDVRAGKTMQLVRRAVLFMVICVFFTWFDKFLLQGIFLRNGWVDAGWAMDDSRTCGVLNGAIFIYARAVFIFVPIFLSIGKCGWIRVQGIIEWPWACLVFAILLPAVLQGVKNQEGFRDGSLFHYVLSSKSFIIELCPYYFLYPLFAGGICFPRGIATLKAGRSWLQCLGITALAVLVFATWWQRLKLDTTSGVDSYNSRHTRWRAMLPRSPEDGPEWPLLELIKENFDMYSGFVAVCFIMLLAAMMPITPTPLSLMGTRVIGCYLTLPLTLIAAGHFLAPGFVHISGFWRPMLVQVGVFSTLLLITSSMTAQNLLPECIVKWASD
jgi:hypothetical protein